jgi:hypothetical protein
MAGTTKLHGVTLPTSTIQGREFFWVVVDAGVDLETSFDTVGSNFQKLVTALQQVSEMHIIGRPNGNVVTIALSMNTTPGSGEFDYNTIGALETAIDDSTGWSTSVYDALIDGDNIRSDI